uniref:Transmembrane emp24 domain-containing protein bai (Trinotate prediction) n=1 Tax=Myxobolus squamalis TaxID=59785 RepID=A0A6B2G284_MYXSQ
MSLILLLSFQIYSGLSIGLTLTSGIEKCVSQDVYKDDMVTAHYSLSSGFPSTTISVFDSRQHVLFNKDSVSDGKFSFVLDKNDHVSFCFRNDGPHGGPLGKIYLNVSFKSYEDVNKKNEAGNDLQVTINVIERVVKFLKAMEENALSFHSRQDNLIEETEKQNQITIFLNLITLIVIMSLGVWQFFHLKKYFRDKHIL